jgi:histidine triad (HIT) family protein
VTRGAPSGAGSGDIVHHSRGIAMIKSRQPPVEILPRLIPGLGRRATIIAEGRVGPRGGGCMTECLFCRVIAGDVPATVVHRDERLTAFRDIRPQAPTHILIVPNVHLTSSNELVEEHVELMGRIVHLAADLARQEGIAAGGYRLVVNTGPDAGQSVGHFHLHLLGGRRLGWPPG